MKRALPLLLLLIAGCSTPMNRSSAAWQEEYARWFNHYKATYVNTGRFPQALYEGPIRRRPEDQTEREAGGVNLLNDPQYRAWGDVRDKIGSAKLCPIAKPELCVLTDPPIYSPVSIFGDKIERSSTTEYLDWKNDPNNPFEPTPREVIAELARMGYPPRKQLSREERRAQNYIGGMDRSDEHEQQEILHGPIYGETRNRIELDRRHAANPRYVRLQVVFSKLDALPARAGASLDLVRELTIALLGGPEESEDFPLARADDRVSWALQDGLISEANYRTYEDLKRPRSDDELARMLIEYFETVIDLCSSRFEAPRELREGLGLWAVLGAAGRAPGVESAAVLQLQRSRDRHYKFVDWDEVLQRAKAEKRPAPEYRCAH